MPLLDVKRQTVNLVSAVKEAARELDRKGVGY